jgi:hypothetical protein
MNEYSSLKVDELKERLKIRGLSLAGKKNELIERLKHADTESIHQDDNNNTNTTNIVINSNTISNINDTNSISNNNDTTKNDNNSNITNHDTINTMTTNNDDTLTNETNDNNNQHMTNSNNNDSTNTNTTTSNTTTSNTKLDLERSLRERLLAKTKLLQQAKQTKNVRIDNFQRPFTLKALQEFLETVLSMKIDDQKIWLNSIKTHCYLTFDTEDDAMTCINKIKGAFAYINPIN